MSAPLAPWTRALVLLAALGLGFLDLRSEWGRLGGAGATDLVVIVVVYLGLALVAYRVTLGAAVVLLTMLAGAPSDLWLPAGIIGLALSGLVVGKTTPRFAATYLAGCLLWLLLVLLVRDDARDVAFVPAAVLVASASVGVAYAALAQRNAAATARISAFEHETLLSIAEERNRIARELHDIVAHHVTMASMHADVVSMSDDAQQRERSLRVIADSTRQALTELRWMLRVLQTTDDLTGEGDDGLRLEATITAIREHLSAFGLRAELEYDRETLAGLPLDVDVALGRILQEAATNVVKHADREQPVVLRTARHAGGVSLELRNGTTDTPGESSSGMGLGNMRARAAERGGTVTGAREGRTWVLRCELPLR